MIEDYTLDKINSFCKNTMIAHLGIEFIEISEQKIVAKMPVNSGTIQPAGRLHGGASAALAESVGSLGSFLLIDSKKYNVLGVEISASHVATTNQNEVFGIGTIVHKGSTSHVWEIKIEDINGKIISICRLTTRIVEKK